jgi:hypothetical protein
MALFPEAGLDLSALPGANLGADLDMIRCRRAGRAEVRLLAGLGWQAASLPTQPSSLRRIRAMAHWLTSDGSDRAKPKPNLWIELPGLSLLFA